MSACQTQTDERIALTKLLYYALACFAEIDLVLSNQSQ